MPPRNQLRRRQQSKAKTSDKKAPKQGSDPTSSASPSSSSSHAQGLKQKVLAVFRLIHIGVMGMLCAASLTHDIAAVLLFSGAIGSMFIALLFVFMSILRTQDRTAVPMPKVYYADGTVKDPDPLTVHDHDNKIATYFASELPAIAVATAWLYMWTSFRPAVLIFSLYLAYRIAYHPIFRIHLWKEPHCPEFERPFGGVPLFKEGPESSVKVVAGKDAFSSTLRAAGSKLVVVDFSATWCAPCRTMAPLFKDLAEEHKDNAVFVTIDVDHSQDVAEEQNISSIPTFVFFRESERLEMMRGASPAKLREAIERHS